MKKDYRVSVKVEFSVFDLNSGWYDDWEWEDVIIEDIEKEDIDEYIQNHKPFPTSWGRDAQIKIRKVSIENPERDIEELE